MTAMELECKKDELREMIDMIESEETANRVGKYLKRMLTREQPLANTPSRN